MNIGLTRAVTISDQSSEGRLLQLHARLHEYAHLGIRANHSRTKVQYIHSLHSFNCVPSSIPDGTIQNHRKCYCYTLTNQILPGIVSDAMLQGPCTATMLSGHLDAVAQGSFCNSQIRGTHGYAGAAKPPSAFSAPVAWQRLSRRGSQSCLQDDLRWFYSAGCQIARRRRAQWIG